MFSGPVAAHAYQAGAAGDPEVIFLAGPSHSRGFEGVSVWPEGRSIRRWDNSLSMPEVPRRHPANPVARDLPAAHAREHSLEMQLPFLRRLLPGVPIVPMVMGHQKRDTIEALAMRWRSRLEPPRAAGREHRPVALLRR